MSDVANAVIPNSIDFLLYYARLAVAVFFCVGGFLTGLKLSEPNFFAKHSVQKVIWQKYLRLVIPYLGAIALAIAVDAPVLLLDEPLAAQDVESTNRIIELLKAAAKAGKTIILVAHVPEAELSWCDQIIKDF